MSDFLNPIPMSDLQTTNYELELLKKVKYMQQEQHEYWRLKKQYGNATSQIEKCKQIERDLKRYVDGRMKELESKQQQLF